MAKTGYTKISNELFDALLSSNLRDAELKIILFFIRYTIGFKRNTIRASYGYIANGTGYSIDSVRKVIKTLMDKGIIERLYEASGSKAQVWKFSYERITTSYVTTVTHDMGAESHLLMGAESHQDIKEHNKDKYIKDKDRKTTYFSTRFSEEFETEEEFLAWMNAQEDED